jgi:hypothetical protein
MKARMIMVEAEGEAAVAIATEAVANFMRRIWYERDGDHYIVHTTLGEGRETIGVVKKFSRIRRGRASVYAQWSAVSTKDGSRRDFSTRAEAGQWLIGTRHRKTPNYEIRSQPSNNRNTG